MSIEKERVMGNFSEEEEELIRAFLFTNPHGDVSFVYPQSLVAGEELSPLMSAYSRTHIPMQDRVLSFLDTAKPRQTKGTLEFIKPMMEIFRRPDGTLRVSGRTGNFNKRWTLAHGHASIKEETALFGHVENVSDIVGKKITGHPLNKPQVKSTRYISYGGVLDMALEDPDILALPDAERFVDYLKYMNSKYLEITEKLADAVFETPDNKAVVEFLRRPENVEVGVNRWIEDEKRVDEEFSPSEDEIRRKREQVLEGLEDPRVREDMGKFVLDYSRVYLTAATRTSMGFSVDARSLEEIITGMISSPRQEDRGVGDAIWAEARKIAPVLLGEKSHIQIDDWLVKNETELRRYLEERFGHLPVRNLSDGVVNLITPRDVEMYNDRFNAALIAFNYTGVALQDLYGAMTDEDVRDVLERSHEHKGKFDVLHPAISHGGLMPELVMGYHGYRDIFRHRRGSRSTQLLSTRLGFEVPEILKVFGMDEEYLTDMRIASEIYEEARITDVHTAEKLVPFGANCRALYSWQPNQIGYTGRLRGRIDTGNTSYVYMARELIEKVGKLMPITAKQFNVDSRDYPAHLWKKGYGWFDLNGG